MKIPRKLWYFLAHNFVAHLSGWVRLKHGAMAWALFAPELGNWVSSWESREMVEKNQTMKVLRMSSPIVEIVPTSDDDIFKLSPASQLPCGAKFKKMFIFVTEFPLFSYVWGPSLGSFCLGCICSMPS